MEKRDRDERERGGGRGVKGERARIRRAQGKWEEGEGKGERARIRRPLALLPSPVALLPYSSSYWLERSLPWSFLSLWARGVLLMSGSSDPRPVELAPSEEPVLAPPMPIVPVVR